jgi:hypothetical protein
MNLTDEQRAICQAARDLDVGSSLKIQAFAGTGKTTTLAELLSRLPSENFFTWSSTARPRVRQNKRCRQM